MGYTNMNMAEFWGPKWGCKTPRSRICPACPPPPPVHLAKPFVQAKGRVLVGTQMRWVQAIGTQGHGGYGGLWSQGCVWKEGWGVSLRQPSTRFVTATVLL